MLSPALHQARALTATGMNLESCEKQDWELRGCRSAELKEKLNDGRSCEATVGGFHSDSLFGGGTQIRRDVNCLSVGSLLDLHVLLPQCSTKPPVGL